MQALKDLAGPPVEAPASTLVVQAESAAEMDNATVKSVTGFTSFFVESGGSIKWTFEVPSEGTYGLNVMTNLRAENERGQHIRIDGTGLRNSEGFGEFFFCSMASTNTGCVLKIENNSWQTVQIRQADLIAEQSSALMLAAGTHTLEIAPSWGYQAFAGIEVVDGAGTVVTTLTPPMATAVGVQEICEEGGYCPSGFQSVELAAGGSLTLGLNVPQGINSGVLRLFYQSESGSMATVAVDGVELTTVSFGAATGAASSDVATIRLPMMPGARQVKVTSPTGGVTLDYAIVLLYEGGSTAVDNGTLPDGYALDQNYPNPSGDRTVIRYELASASPVTLTVYDLLGRKVATLVDGMEGPGSHDVSFDTNRLSSGTYFYRIQTAVGQQVRKMTVVK